MMNNVQHNHQQLPRFLNIFVALTEGVFLFQNFLSLPRNPCATFAQELLNSWGVGIRLTPPDT